MLLMKCNGLSLGYDKKQIASGVTFTVSEGDYIAITGDNGAGKSTLVKTLLGLIPPLDGEIELSPTLCHRHIGYLPQSSYTPRDFPASVYEVVLSGCIADEGAFPFYRSSHKKKVQDNMKKLGISELAKKSFFELSGGQAQRVLLCRALCAAKKMLLLDEPVAGLDPHATHDMYRAVRELNKNEGLAVMMVSHDICTTLEYATHVLHLGEDHVSFMTTEEYRKSEIGRAFIYAHGGEEK